MDFFSSSADSTDTSSLFGGHFRDIFATLAPQADSIEPPSAIFKANVFDHEPSTPSLLPTPEIPYPKSRRQPSSIADNPNYSSEKPKFSFNEDPKFKQSKLTLGGNILHEVNPYDSVNIPAGCVAPADVIPQQFLSLFKYPYLTRVQSNAAPRIFDNEDHVVIQAPTGSGKTALFEFAILKAMMSHGHNFKAVYLVPIKALCSEKSAEWAKLFSSLKLNLLSINGDTDEIRAAELKKAHIIISTPEKFDSLTRAFQDRTQFIQSINLLLVDEIHMLCEDIRGACIETVVTRMLTFASTYHDAPIGKLRVVCASATIPNAEDLASWVNAKNRLFYDNSYRPIPLKIISEAVQPKKNIFLTLKSMSGMILNFLAKYSDNKQTIVFCATRALAVEAAKACVGKFADSGIKTSSKELNNLLKSGVAYHHAGLGSADRAIIEKGFLDHNIQVLCSTTTLALGVNLPAHLVIILGPYNYNHTEFEPIHPFRVLQMAGRAGRNGLDDSGVALIVHSNEHTHMFRALENTSLPVESTLLGTLSDHLLSEIVCGTISSASQSYDWIQRTFLFQRKRNCRSVQDVSSWSRNEIEKSLSTLYGLGAIVEDKGIISATPIGHTICRYYIPIKVAENWLISMKSIASMHDVLIECLNCSEFDDFPSRIHERDALNQLNKEVRFKYKLSIKTAQLKAQLLVQLILGGFNLEETEMRFGGKLEISRNSKDIMNSSKRLMACFLELTIHANHPQLSVWALELVASLNSGFWAPEIPRHINYISLINGVGKSSVGALLTAGVKTVDDLANYTSHQLSTILPPATRGTETINKIMNVRNALPEPVTEIDYDGKILNFTVCGSNSCALASRDSWTLLITNSEKIIVYKRLYPKEEFTDKIEINGEFSFTFAHESLSGISFHKKFSVSHASEIELLNEKHSQFITSSTPSFVDPSEFDRGYDFAANNTKAPKPLDAPKLPPPTRIVPSNQINDIPPLPRKVNPPMPPAPPQSEQEKISLPSFLTNKDEFIECIAQAIRKSRQGELWKDLD